MDYNVLKSKEKKISNFFGQKIILSQPNISDNELLRFKELGFELHFLPKIEIFEDKKFFGWFDPPKNNFYALIKKGKLSSSSAHLSGKWVLVDARDKPARHYPWLAKEDLFVFLMKIFGINFYQKAKNFNKQQYQDDCLLNILKNNGFFSRYSLSWREINEVVKPEFANFLSVSKEKIRLPYFVEWNYLANFFYPQWGKTTTWEWFNDQLKTGECLAGGCQNLSVLGWDPPDFWSTILGFRFLIEI